MITAKQVWAQIGTAAAAPGTPDDIHMSLCVDAVNTFVLTGIPDVREWPEIEWPPDVHLGAVTLAARMYARRGSPTGVAAFTDAGPSYLAKWDPDLERLFHIGSWSRPRVG